MRILQIEHPVDDDDISTMAFDSDPLGREQSGVRRYRIVRPVDDPRYVIVDLEFDSSDDAKAFHSVPWDAGHVAVVVVRAEGDQPRWCGMSSQLIGRTIRKKIANVAVGKSTLDGRLGSHALVRRSTGTSRPRSRQRSCRRCGRRPDPWPARADLEGEHALDHPDEDEPDPDHGDQDGQREGGLDEGDEAQEQLEDPHDQHEPPAGGRRPRARRRCSQLLRRRGRQR